MKDIQKRPLANAWGAGGILPPCAQLLWCELYVMKDSHIKKKQNKADGYVDSGACLRYTFVVAIAERPKMYSLRILLKRKKYHKRFVFTLIMGRVYGRVEEFCSGLRRTPPQAKYTPSVAPPNRGNNTTCVCLS